MTTGGKSDATDEVIVRTVAVGGSAFSRALQAGELGSSWYAERPAGVAAWRTHAWSVLESFGGRDWLGPLLPAFTANGTGTVPARLSNAARNGVLITTGQQPGLFGGPGYTWSKAVSALAVADALEAELGIPVAPVFWAATDDADWLEAAVTHLATSHGLEELSLAGPPSDGVAMREVASGPLSGLLERLMLACGSGAHPSVIEAVRAAYTDDSSVGAAYLGLLRHFLEPLGIAVFDAGHPAARAAAHPFLCRALESADAVDQALRARVAEIKASGYFPQVELMDGLSLVFNTPEPGAERSRIQLSEALHTARTAAPGSLGANVLLRPVIERSLMPTLCYMGGPGEFAYFAQVAPVATAIGLPVPVTATRWACEVVEASTLARQKQLGVDDAQLMDPHAAEQAVARRELDQSLEAALSGLRAHVSSQVDTLGEVLSRIPMEKELVADSVLEGLDRDLQHRLDRFERRLLAGVKRLNADLMRETAALRAALRPLGQSPERVLNFIPILARYGPAIFDRMRSRAAQHARCLVTGQPPEG